MILRKLGKEFSAVVMVNVLINQIVTTKLNFTQKRLAKKLSALLRVVSRNFV